MSKKRKQLICLTSVLLCVVSVWYRLEHPFEQKRVKELTYTNSRILKSDSGKSGSHDDGGRADKTTPNGQAVRENDGLPVYSDPLFAEFFDPRPGSGSVHKDLFALYKKKQPIKREPVQKPNRKKVSPPPLPPPKEDPAQKVMDYMAAFTFLGHYESAGKKAVFLALKKLVLVVRAGDRINGKYLVKQITNDSLTIDALDIGKTINFAFEQFKDFDNE